jgi:hypothetical protein
MSDDTKECLVAVGLLLALVAGIVLLRIYGGEFGPGCR